MPQLACQLQFRILETHDNFKKNLFFSTGAFQVLSYNLCLKFRHCVGTASTYIPDRRQCQQSKNVFSSDLCLCAGSLLSVNLHHSLASWPLQHIALGSWLWCRFRLRFVGLGNHRGDLCVAALDLLLHVREIGCRDVKLSVQPHVRQMMSHFAPQCCHGLVVLDLPTASPQSNELGNDMKRKTRGKERNMTAWTGAFVQQSNQKPYPHG